jgi:predicted enzyme related to lactoylglutathione lyase
MPHVDSYPAGVPCWVETLQPDLPAAMAFYAEVFGWNMVADDADDPTYTVASVGGREVAGLGSAPALGADEPVAWYTQVRVDDLGDAVSRAVESGATDVNGPVDASPAGRVAFLTDPCGARLGLWEPAAREGAELVDETNAWAMSVVQTPDPARSRRFYAEVFGWQAEPMGPADLFRLPGYVGGTEQQPVPRDTVAVGVPAADAAAIGWHVDFWNDDVAALADRVRGGGGSVLAGPAEDNGFRRVVVRDPAGATFSVSQLLLP